jgi:Predicted membrane protein
MKKAYRLAGWAIVWLTALFFLQNGVQKVIGTEQMVGMFRELGYPDWFRIAVGLIEIAGAVLLAIPRFTPLASAGMALLMIGAAASEAMAGHAFEVLIPAQWLIVFILILYARIRIRHAAADAAKRPLHPAERDRSASG